MCIALVWNKSCVIDVDRCVWGEIYSQWGGGSHRARPSAVSHTERKFGYSSFQPELRLKPVLQPVSDDDFSMSGILRVLSYTFYSVILEKKQQNGTDSITWPNSVGSFGAYGDSCSAWLYQGTDRYSCSVSANDLHLDLSYCGSDVSGW